MAILLLEPDTVLGRQTKEMLELAGYQVVWAQQAQSAIKLADKQKPNLIITELLLPGHSGAEFIYELRSYQDWRNIPVIILSSLSPDQAGLSPSKFSDFNIVKYLTKAATTFSDLGRAIKGSTNS